MDQVTNSKSTKKNQLFNLEEYLGDNPKTLLRIHIPLRLILLEGLQIYFLKDEPKNALYPFFTNFWAQIVNITLTVFSIRVPLHSNLSISGIATVIVLAY